MAEKVRASSDAPSKIEFHYQKSPSYRTVHADGAFGGATPRGYLAVTFFGERATIPRKGVREVTSVSDEEVKLGPETVIEGLEGVMRQLEVTVMLDVNASRELLIWLQRHVAELEEGLGIPADQRAAPIKGS